MVDDIKAEAAKYFPQWVEQREQLDFYKMSMDHKVSSYDFFFLKKATQFVGIFFK